MAEPRHHKSSSPWRCLSSLQYAAYAIAVLLLLEPLDGFVCRLMPAREPDGTCATIGPWLAWLAIGVMVMSAIVCAARAWRDFNKPRSSRTHRS